VGPAWSAACSWTVMRTACLLACAAFLGACSTSAPDSRSVASDAGALDEPRGEAGTEAAAVYAGGCPPTLPPEGAPCSTSSACEYPFGANPLCTILAYCPLVAMTPVGDGQASAGSADGDGGPGRFWRHSTPSDPSCAPTPAACPASFGALASGSACPVNAICTYPEGRCNCIPCTPPDGGVSDAGAADASTQWVCEAWMTPAGCPEPRPLLGTACSNEGQECDYGEGCGSPVDLPDPMGCRGGVWVDTRGGCGAGAPGVCGSP
jgi:hypothetical protein